jgi:ribosomal protein S18 acetylase RimI-like enzyme
MEKRAKPGFFWVFEELLTNELRHRLTALCNQVGLKKAATAYGMASNRIPRASPSHPSLSFIRVANEQHLLAYADINSLAYSIPEESGRDGISRSTLLREDAFAYLGLLDGVPVSTAAAIETNDRLVIALVATKPGLQRRGFADATVRKALYEASRATGITRSVLHASEGSRSLYERIGYHYTSTIRLLSPAE